MKLSFAALGLGMVSSQKVSQLAQRKFTTGVREANEQISLGTRSDGNALLISQMLEFYLTVVHGLEADKVEMMLSYGCYCQLLTNRKIGVGQPVDRFDEICRRYQQCTQCVAHDESGKGSGSDNSECNWESGRYEISFVQGSNRVDCSANLNDCGINLCKCDEQLAFEMAENVDLFNAKHSAQRGFEFGDECRPSGGGGGSRGSIQCCGDYPDRIPYRDSSKACCGTHVYSPAQKQCCADGSVVGLSGECK